MVWGGGIPYLLAIYHILLFIHILLTRLQILICHFVNLRGKNFLIKKIKSFFALSISFGSIIFLPILLFPLAYQQQQKDFPLPLLFLLPLLLLYLFPCCQSISLPFLLSCSERSLGQI